MRTPCGDYDQVRDAARKGGTGFCWLGWPARLRGVAGVLRAVDVRPVDEKMGRDAGALLAKSRTDDPIDATVVVVAHAGDWILTSKPLVEIKFAMKLELLHKISLSL